MRRFIQKRYFLSVRSTFSEQLIPEVWFQCALRRTPQLCLSTLQQPTTLYGIAASPASCIAIPT